MGWTEAVSAAESAGCAGREPAGAAARSARSRMPSGARPATTAMMPSVSKSALAGAASGYAGHRPRAAAKVAASSRRRNWRPDSAAWRKSPAACGGRTGSRSISDSREMLASKGLGRGGARGEAVEGGGGPLDLRGQRRTGVATREFADCHWRASSQSGSAPRSQPPGKAAGTGAGLNAVPDRRGWHGTAP